MKNLKLTLCFFMITSMAFAQSKTSIDLSIQGGESFRAYSEIDNSPTFDNIIDSRNQHERHLNYNIGVALNKNITNNLVFRTGVNYSSFRYITSDLKDLKWGSEHDGVGGWEFDPSLPHEIKNSVSNSFLGIPLLVRYELNRDKLSPFVELGPSLSLLTSSQFHVKTDIDSNKTSISEKFNSTNVFGLATIGWNYTTSKKYQYFGAVNFTRQLNNFRTEIITEKLYAYGFVVGIRMSLDKERQEVIKS